MNILICALMGLAYVAPPGPVNLETVRRGVAGGFRAGLVLQLGAVLGDLLYAGTGCPARDNCRQRVTVSNALVIVA
jgi:threonine/homoserine/homoserine lactone efflux protein